MNSNKTSHGKIGLVLITSVASLALSTTSEARSRRAKPANAELKRIEAVLAAQAAELAAQNQRLSDQDSLIAAQRRELDAMRLGPSVQAFASKSNPNPITTAPSGTDAGVTPPASASPAQVPDQPVGQGPDTNIKPAVLAALPDQTGVLTPPHHFVFTPSIEYDRSSTNRLVFQGVEIIPGLQLGLVNANAVNNDTVLATGDLRYGLTDRLELEVMVPYLYRHDLITTLAQQVTTGTAPVNQTTELEGKDLGDLEFDLRYQLNKGLDGHPIFLGNIRVKTDTGVGPYDVRFDSSGIAQSLATGSGFWGVEPSVTMLLPSDPVVIFASLGYLYNIDRNINKFIGTTHVGEVSPGNSVDLSFGFGFSVNPAFSFSLGYTNNYIFGTRQQLGTTTQRSTDLEIGALTFGWSYRLRNDLLLSNTLEFGVTPESPNVRIIFRLPFTI